MKIIIVFVFLIGISLLGEGNKASLEEIPKKAEQGNAEAQYQLGLRYLDGKDIQKDEVKAFEWFKKAAEQGHSKAQCALGYCYNKGQGIQKDEKKGVEWYSKSAEQGYDNAQKNLALCYLQGTGVPKDEVKALEWYSKSAEQNNSDAQLSLGFCYLNGKGTKQDLVKGFEYYKKAADQNNSLGQLMIGDLYQNGIGVEKDEFEAFEYYQKAAEQGNANAQNNLGYYYEAGIGGQTANPEKAFEWYKKAAEQGIIQAQINIGLCYKLGVGTEADESKSSEWFNKVAERYNKITGDAYKYISFGDDLELFRIKIIPISGSEVQFEDYFSNLLFAEYDKISKEDKAIFEKDFKESKLFDGIYTMAGQSKKNIEADNFNNKTRRLFDSYKNKISTAPIIVNGLSMVFVFEDKQFGLSEVQIKFIENPDKSVVLEKLKSDYGVLKHRVEKITYPAVLMGNQQYHGLMFDSDFYVYENDSIKVVLRIDNVDTMKYGYYTDKKIIKDADESYKNFKIKRVTEDEKKIISDLSSCVEEYKKSLNPSIFNQFLNRLSLPAASSSPILTKESKIVLNKVSQYYAKVVNTVLEKEKGDIKSQKTQSNKNATDF